MDKALISNRFRGPFGQTEDQPWVDHLYCSVYVVVHFWLQVFRCLVVCEFSEEVAKNVAW